MSTALLSQAGVITLAIIGAAAAMMASVLRASGKLSNRAATHLGNAGYLVTGISIAIFLYLGFVE